MCDLKTWQNLALNEDQGFSALVKHWWSGPVPCLYKFGLKTTALGSQIRADLASDRVELGVLVGIVRQS